QLGGAVEESDAADTDGSIALSGKSFDDIRLRKRPRRRTGGFAAGKSRGEQPRVRSGFGRSRQKAGEERLVCRKSEGGRGMSAFPLATRQQGLQVRGAT